MRMPAHRVRVCQPTHELGEFVVSARPKDEMPVIWHQAVGQDPGRMAILSLLEHASGNARHHLEIPLPRSIGSRSRILAGAEVDGRAERDERLVGIG